MKIKKILDQTRRDFVAMMECQFCGHEEKNGSGYDDRYYHDNVIPEMKCKKCGKSTNSENATVEIRPTKYPEGYQI
jgi:transcription elongation factor Elf1